MTSQLQITVALNPLATMASAHHRKRNLAVPGYGGVRTTDRLIAGPVDQAEKSAYKMCALDVMYLGVVKLPLSSKMEDEAAIRNARLAVEGLESAVKFGDTFLPGTCILAVHDTKGGEMSILKHDAAVEGPREETLAVVEEALCNKTRIASEADSRFPMWSTTCPRGIDLVEPERGCSEGSALSSTDRDYSGYFIPEGSMHIKNMCLVRHFGSPIASKFCARDLLHATCRTVESSEYCSFCSVCLKRVNKNVGCKIENKNVGSKIGNKNVSVSDSFFSTFMFLVFLNICSSFSKINRQLHLANAGADLNGDGPPRAKTPGKAKPHKLRGRSVTRVKVATLANKATRKKARRLRRQEQLRKQAVHLRNENPPFPGTIVGRGDYWQDIGGHIGRWLGGKAGSWFQSIFGSGDYSAAPHSFQVERNSLTGNGAIPTMHASEGQPHDIFHHDYIADVGMTIDPTLRVIPLDISNPLSFPWAVGLSANYQQWEIMGMVLVYRPLSADAVASPTASLGTIVLATEYDVYAPEPSNKTEIANMAFTTTGKPSQPQVHPIECARNQTQIPLLKILQTGQIVPDLQFYQHAKCYVFTQGAAADYSAAGELWVAYHIRLHKPRLPGIVGSGLGAFVNCFNVFVTPFDGPLANPVLLYNNIGLDVLGDHSSFSLPYNMAPNTVILVIYQVYGSSTSGQVPLAVTPINGLSRVKIFADNTGFQQVNALLNPTTSVTAAFDFGVFTIFYDGTGTVAAPPTCTIQLASTPSDTNFATLLVQVINSASAPASSFVHQMKGRAQQLAPMRRQALHESVSRVRLHKEGKEELHEEKAPFVFMEDDEVIAHNRAAMLKLRGVIEKYGTPEQKAEASARRLQEFRENKDYNEECTDTAEDSDTQIASVLSTMSVKKKKQLSAFLSDDLVSTNDLDPGDGKKRVGQLGAGAKKGDGPGRLPPELSTLLQQADIARSRLQASLVRLDAAALKYGVTLDSLTLPLNATSVCFLDVAFELKEKTPDYVPDHMYCVIPECYGYVESRRHRRCLQCRRAGVQLTEKNAGAALDGDGPDGPIQARLCQTVCGGYVHYHPPKGKKRPGTSPREADARRAKQQTWYVCADKSQNFVAVKDCLDFGDVHLHLLTNLTPAYVKVDRPVETTLSSLRVDLKNDIEIIPTKFTDAPKISEIIGTSVKIVDVEYYDYKIDDKKNVEKGSVDLKTGKVVGKEEKVCIEADGGVSSVSTKDKEKVSSVVSSLSGVSTKGRTFSDVYIPLILHLYCHKPLPIEWQAYVLSNRIVGFRVEMEEVFKLSPIEDRTQLQEFINCKPGVNYCSGQCQDLLLQGYAEWVVRHREHLSTLLFQPAHSEPTPCTIGEPLLSGSAVVAPGGVSDGAKVNRYCYDLACPNYRPCVLHPVPDFSAVEPKQIKYKEKQALSLRASAVQSLSKVAEQQALTKNLEHHGFRVSPTPIALPAPAPPVFASLLNTCLGQTPVVYRAPALGPLVEEKKPGPEMLGGEPIVPAVIFFCGQENPDFHLGIKLRETLLNTVGFPFVRRETTHVDSSTDAELVEVKDTFGITYVPRFLFKHMKFKGTKMMQKDSQILSVLSQSFNNYIETKIFKNLADYLIEHKDVYGRRAITDDRKFLTAFESGVRQTASLWEGGKKFVRINPEMYTNTVSFVCQLWYVLNLRASLMIPQGVGSVFRVWGSHKGVNTNPRIKLVHETAPSKRPLSQTGTSR